MDEKRDVIFTKSFDCIIDMDVKHGIKRVEKFSRRILATSVVQLGGFLYVKISPAISYFSFSKNALLRKNPAY